MFEGVEVDRWNSTYSTVAANSGTWGSGGGGPVISTATAATSALIDASLYQHAQTIRWSLTANTILASPTNPTDGKKLELWFTSSGTDATITFDTGIVIPTDSSFAGALTIANGKKAKILLEYDGILNGGQWELSTLINGY